MTADEIVLAAAAVPFACGTIVAAVAVLRAPAARAAAPAELAAGLALALEFLLAAGLLRLSSLDDFGAIGIVAAIVALRRVIGSGLRAGLRALGLARISRLRA